MTEIKLLQPVSFNYQGKVYLFDRMNISGNGGKLRLTATATQVIWHSLDEVKEE